MSRKKRKNTKQREDEFSIQIKDTPLERLEGRLIAFFGSWLFLLLHIVFFGLWLLLKWNYSLLTFWVSLEAIVLSILILIRTNLETENDRQRAIKDYKIDLSVAKRIKYLEKEIKELKSLVQKQK